MATLNLLDIVQPDTPRTEGTRAPGRTPTLAPLLLVSKRPINAGRYWAILQAFEKGWLPVSAAESIPVIEIDEMAEEIRLAGRDIGAHESVVTLAKLCSLVPQSDVADIFGVTRARVSKLTRTLRLASPALVKAWRSKDIPTSWVEAAATGHPGDEKAQLALIEPHRK